MMVELENGNCCSLLFEYYMFISHKKVLGKGKAYLFSSPQSIQKRKKDCVCEREREKQRGNSWIMQLIFGISFFSFMNMVYTKPLGGTYLFAMCRVKKRQS